MSNFLKRLEIDMETKIFSFLVIFFTVFLGIDIVSIIMVQIPTFSIIYWYIIPLIVTLIIAGVVIDKVVSSMRRRAMFLLLLIPEGFLTIILGFNIGNATAQAILWIFIGVFSGFTIVSILALFLDTTSQEQRGKVAGLISGIAWLVAAVLLSWIGSTIFAPEIVMFVFAAVKLAGGAVSVYLLFRKSEETSESLVKFQSTSGIGGLLKDSYKFIWSDKKFLRYLIAFILIWVAQGIFVPIGGAGQFTYQSYQQMASIGFAAGGFLLIVSGYVLDKEGRKRILFIGGFLATISFVSYYFLLGAVFLGGISMLVTTIIVILGDLAPSDAKGRYCSIFLLFNFGAFFVGFLIGLILGGGYQVNGSPFVALACLIITAIALIFIYFKGEAPETQPPEKPLARPSEIPLTEPSETL